MQLSYSLTNEDYLAFNRFHITHTKEFRRVIIITRILFLVLILAFYIVLRERIAENNIYLIPFFIAAAIFLLGALLAKPINLFVILRRAKKMINAETKGEPRDIVLSIDKKSIRTDGKTGTTDIPLSEIKRFAECDGYLFVYIGENSSFIIPERVFSSEDEKEKFISYLPKTNS